MSVLSQMFRADPHRPSRAAGLFDLADLGRDARGENEATIRALCANAYLGGDRALARVLGRYKMFVDTSDVGHSTHLMLDGYWEMWVTEAIAAAVRPGMTCVDVGANLGYFTLLMADLTGPHGVVHAFEPNPRIAARLRDSISVNGFNDRAIVHQVALGEDEGAPVLLVVPEHEPKNAHVVAARPGLPVAGDVLLTHRLDTVAAIADADFVKIDADTAEQAIWHGMAGLFARPWPMTVFMEFAAARYVDPGSFLERVAADGFTLAHITISNGIQPVDRATVLAAPATQDQMLVLRR